ncbi:MAG: M20/M25/M40 family metallo-hydrolase [Balneolaceae bacterium]
MKYKLTSFLTLLFIAGTGLLTSQCTKSPEITEGNVARIIQALSSDEMKGRAAFSSEAALAANFISSEFAKIGLAPLAPLETFHQSFIVYTISPQQADVSINGKEIVEDDYFTRVFAKHIKWEKHDIDIHRISGDDNFRESIRNYLRDDIPSVVMVDKAHKEWFHRYRSYFSRPTRTLELDNSQSDVFILSEDEVSTLTVNVESSVQPIELFNVVGKIEGHLSDEIVIFSAHYDHIGVKTTSEGDSIANGANDNASGVAAVIELARHFSERPTPERTLLFVGFTAEEAGGYGSKYFSEQLNPDHIVAMFNIEMIGKPAVNGPNSAWITGYERSTFGEILQQSVEDSSFIFYPDPYPNQNLFYRSDNATLARLGVPAHSISTTPIDVDEDYHRVTDEFKTINITHATSTIAAIAKAAEEITSGRKTPTRIDPETVD